MDPRLYQIAALAGLLIYGVRWLEFDITWQRAALLLGGALGAQWLCTRAWRLPRFEWRSALISGLSLCLLLRTNDSWLALGGAVVAVASKFIVRWRGKHLCNPTNIGLAVLVLASNERVWVSPGQWGSVAFFAFLTACLGGLVVMRAGRSDVALAFLGCYLALVIGWSMWLGDPMTIPFHRLQNGALLLFAFFMVSDPRTTPDSRPGRIVFAALVAWGAWYWQFRLFHTNGLLWSLALFSLFTPVLDWLLPGERYAWRCGTPGSGPAKTSCDGDTAPAVSAASQTQPV